MQSLLIKKGQLIVAVEMEAGRVHRGCTKLDNFYVMTELSVKAIQQQKC
jgi:hypothetical protein